MSVAILPTLFVLEATMPPAAQLCTAESIDIAASPDKVWKVITSDKPIGLPPGLPGLAGLSYPVRGQLLGEGIAEERVTEWRISSLGIASMSRRGLGSRPGSDTSPETATLARAGHYKAARVRVSALGRWDLETRGLLR